MSGARHRTSPEQPCRNLAEATRRRDSALGAWTWPVPGTGRVRKGQYCGIRLWFHRIECGDSPSAVRASLSAPLSAEGKSERSASETGHTRRNFSVGRGTANCRLVFVKSAWNWARSVGEKTPSLISRASHAPSRPALLQPPPRCVRPSIELNRRSKGTISSNRTPASGSPSGSGARPPILDPEERMCSALEKDWRTVPLPAREYPRDKDSAADRPRPGYRDTRT
jgi:hypothetical protein